MYEVLVPKSLEDTIITYLKTQEEPLEDYDLGYDDASEIARQDIKAILDELFVRVNKRIACRDRYDNLKQWHHQHALFDLSEHIPEFCMTDELIEKLAFRETLLISALDPNVYCKEVEPKAVGGLCLDVQNVEGHLAEKREKPGDADLDRQVLDILRRAKEVAAKSPALENDAVERMVQEKLREYENFLKNEMQQNVKKFVVHLSSQFDVGGSNAGSRITCWADRHLHTLEEKRTEYVRQEDATLNEKSIYVALQNNKYYIRSTSSVEGHEDRHYYALAKTHNFVSEGANFLLQRYLAITKFEGAFELSTMYINGDMCRNIYECPGPKPGEVNGKTVEICKIYRYIIEECGIEHHCVTVLTTHGRIVTQEWEGCDYILNMNPLQFIQSGPPSPYDRLVLAKTWEHDLQLMSKYLDCKTDAELKMKTYMKDHPEVKDMMADYVQNILMLKPENIMSFTMDYFQSLYPFKIARLNYIEETEAEPEMDNVIDMYE